ncbi:putative RDD family membrane protein YckC [Spinactinospora alkalitolerans]|uniref:Putative RDD family membrane protein YckC n=1 Tax=Spinactinospora alkalitolerans TaxID=687207 RepID=A0A852TYA8_9ACTN|nr:RDD family protein [Spinactinospora alkalitolerans]NYE48771.1 putative RDD family membrane protein YckC [Spinactinospora alkalitolerans]
MGNDDGRGGRGSADGVDDTGFVHRGNRLGLPETGSGSVPGMGRRLAAIFLDWLLSLAVTYALFGADTSAVANITLLVFAVSTIGLLTLFGTTVGKRMVGIRIAATGERPVPWPVAMAVRTVLLCLVIPAVIYDRDQRGLHDRAAGTVTLRF